MPNILPEPFIIAVDGPAASGKGTVARKLAKHFNLPHLDTGLMYRAVARALLDAELPLEDEEAAVEMVKKLDLDDLNPDILRARGMGEAAAKVAVLPRLRENMREKQRELAQTKPGIVMDGRDIGTVVCPDANVKLFVTADAEIRAERRFKEMVNKGFDVKFDNILNDIQKRDEKDRNRKVAPLKMTEDSHLCDTSKLSIDAAFTMTLEIVMSELKS